MGINIDRIIGVVLLLIGISMLLICADLAFVQKIAWTPMAISDVAVLTMIAVTAIGFGSHYLLRKPGR